MDVADDSAPAAVRAVNERRAARRTIASYAVSSAELAEFLDILDLRPDGDERYRGVDRDVSGFNDAGRR